MRLDPAFGVDGEEQFGRTRQHDRLAEAEQRAVADRLTLGQRVESRQRLARPVSVDRKGQIALVAVALADMAMQPRKFLRIDVERPCGLGVEDRAVAGGLPRLWPLAVGRGVEHAEADERRAAVSGQERHELRLQQVACFVGEIAGQPFAGLVCRLRRGQSLSELFRGICRN